MCQILEGSSCEWGIFLFLKICSSLTSPRWYLILDISNSLAMSVQKKCILSHGLWENRIYDVKYVLSFTTSGWSHRHVLSNSSTHPLCWHSLQPFFLPSRVSCLTFPNPILLASPSTHSLSTMGNMTKKRKKENGWERQKIQEGCFWADLS